MLQACLLVLDPPLILPAPTATATDDGQTVVWVNIPAGLPNVYN